MLVVLVRREQRARRQVIEQRSGLNRVLEGLRGADDIHHALQSRLHQPLQRQLSVAELAAVQDHARKIAEHMREVLRLKRRACERAEQMRERLNRCSQQWQKAQSRVAQA